MCTPFRIELASNSSGDPTDPGFTIAIASAPTAPSVIATVFAADDGERSVYNDTAVLRAGGSGQTYTGTSAPAPEIDLSGSFVPGGADGDGE